MTNTKLRIHSQLMLGSSKFTEKSLKFKINNYIPSYLSFGDPLFGKSSLLCFLVELAASTGASPRSTLDGMGGGPAGGGLLPDIGGGPPEEGI